MITAQTQFYRTFKIKSLFMGVDKAIWKRYPIYMISDRHTLRWWSVGLDGGYRIDVDYSRVIR